MHPEMIRAIAAQQMTDRLAEARAWRWATVARQARKACRHGHNGPDPLAGVRIPDYVDATFEGLAGRVAAGGHPAGGTAARRDAA